MVTLLPLTQGCEQKAAPVQGLDRHISPSVPTSDLDSRGTTRGTVDGGGGAGLAGKPLEAYRRNIENLAEFPEFALVDQVLKSIANVSAEHHRLFRHIIRSRSWLFVDQPVQKISESRQGVPFTIDQWAVQNTKEIWVSNHYAGSAQDKAKILLHEILVGLKLMRFLSYNEYCHQWSENPALCGNESAALIPHPKLSDLDHAEVRKMGEWLWQNHTTMSRASFGAEMHANQFQSPHYSWRPYESYHLETKVMNPILEQISENPHFLFTGWGRDGVATQICRLEFSRDREKQRLSVNLAVLDIRTRQETRHLLTDLQFSSEPEHRSIVRASALGRQADWHSSEGKPMQSMGDREKTATFGFVGRSIVEFYTAVSMVDRAYPNGARGQSSSANEPEGAYCSSSPVRLPVQYEVWLELREQDRLQLERRTYDGKTIEELLSEVSRRPEFQNINSTGARSVD